MKRTILCLLSVAAIIAGTISVSDDGLNNKTTFTENVYAAERLLFPIPASFAETGARKSGKIWVWDVHSHFVLRMLSETYL